MLLKLLLYTKNFQQDIGIVCVIDFHGKSVLKPIWVNTGPDLNPIFFTALPFVIAVKNTKKKK